MEQINQRDAGPAAWVTATHEALLSDGLQAISIAKLARKLGVSRGAFYWHFENREALVQRALPGFAENAIPAKLKQLETLGPDTGMLALLDHAYLPDDGDRIAQRHLQVLEDWASQDMSARKAFSSVVLKRVKIIRQFLHKAGIPYSEARIRAQTLDRLLFAPREHQDKPDRASYATDLEYLYWLHFGHNAAPGVLSRHVNRTLPARQSSNPELAKCDVQQLALRSR